MSSPPDPVRLGRELATRHGPEAIGVDDTLTLLAVAESPRVDDWTLRSALVRFAQPQPELSGAILESVRRTQAALHPVVRELQRHGVTTDRRLSIDPDGDGDGCALAPVADPVPDVRVSDLARILRAIESAGRVDASPDAAADTAATATATAAVVEAYEAAGEATPLEAAELDAIPLLVVALDLDELGEILASWAATVAPAEPPVDEARRLGRMAFDRLGELGVARETGGRPPGRPPPGGRRG